MPQSDEIKKESYLDILDSLLKNMKYGTITVIVQDGKVIQIDKTDRVLRNSAWQASVRGENSI